MHSTDHMVDVLRQTTALDGLAFDSEGRLELIIENVLPLYLIKISNTEIEIGCRLAITKEMFSLNLFKKLLIANYMGDATGPARLAIDPSSDRVILCHRINVTHYGAAAFEAEINRLVRYAFHWYREGVDHMIETEKDYHDTHTEEFNINDMVIMRA